MGSSTPTAAILLALTLGAAPQSAPEYDLTWKLPHDRAALYDVYDAAKGTKTGEFCLLACELETRVGAIQGSDLPYRFLFRLPKKKVKVGDQWEVREYVFADAPFAGRGVSPLEAVGTIRLSRVSRATYQSLLGLRSAVQSQAESEFAIIESTVRFFRCRVDERQRIQVLEKVPSLSMFLTTLARVSDSAVFGGRFSWSGRLDAFNALGAAPISSQVGESTIVVLRTCEQELSRSALEGRVNQAIENGTKWLRSQVAADGSVTDRGGYEGKCRSGIGSTSLAYMALLPRAEGKSDSLLEKMARFIRGKRSSETYDISLQLLALEANLQLSKVDEGKPSSDLELARQLAGQLISHQGNHGGFGYKSGETPDLSNTVHAALGLRSASRLGVKIPSSTWQSLLKYLEMSSISTQRKKQLSLEYSNGSVLASVVEERGWGYRPALEGSSRDDWTTGVNASMTYAAVASLVICASELDSKSVSQESLSRCLLGGCVWIQEHYGLRSNFPEGSWPSANHIYYSLFGLERSCLLAGIRTIGGHDWYCEGAYLLLSWQSSSGHWEGPQASPIIDTAFALLFLKRGIAASEYPRPYVVAPVETPRKQKE